MLASLLWGVLIVVIGNMVTVAIVGLGIIGAARIARAGDPHERPLNPPPPRPYARSDEPVDTDDNVRPLIAA